MCASIVRAHKPAYHLRTIMTRDETDSTFEMHYRFSPEGYFSTLVPSKVYIHVYYFGSVSTNLINTFLLQYNFVVCLRTSAERTLHAWTTQFVSQDLQTKGIAVCAILDLKANSVTKVTLLFFTNCTAFLLRINFTLSSWKIYIIWP